MHARYSSVTAGTRGLVLALVSALVIGVVLFICPSRSSATSWVANVAAGNGPCAIAIDHSTGLAYVENQNSSDISVINTSTRSRVTEIPVAVTGCGSFGHTIAINEATNHIYVCTGNAVADIDGSNGGGFYIQLGDSSGCVYLISRPDGVLYAALNDSSVALINEASDSIITVYKFGTGTDPQLAADPTNNLLYVVGLTNMGVSMVILNTWTERVTGVNLSSPPSYNGQYPDAVGIVVDPSNETAYVAIPPAPGSTGTGILNTVNGGNSSVTATYSLGSGPTDIAIDPTGGKVYTTDHNQMDILDIATGQLQVDTQNAIGQDHLAIDSSNGVLYGVTPNNCVQTSFNASSCHLDGICGGSWQETNGASEDPQAIAVDPTSHIVYIANEQTDNVTIFQGCASPPPPPPPPYEVAFQDGGGSLWSVGAAGTTDWNLGVAAGTSPSVIRLSSGGYEIAFQSTSGTLWTVGSAGWTNWGVGVAPGTSPSITRLSNGGFEVAFQAAGQALWTVGSAGWTNWGLQMAPRTSPSISSLSNGGFQVAFQAAGQSLWTVGTAGWTNWQLGVAPSTSPTITQLSNGGFEASFQAAGQSLWTVGSSGWTNWNVGVAPGTSPSIAGLSSGGYQVAFQAAGGALWTVGSAGWTNWGVGVASGTSPSVAPLTNDGFEVAFQANGGSLWTIGSAGWTNWNLGMAPATSPAET